MAVLHLVNTHNRTRFRERSPSVRFWKLVDDRILLIIKESLFSGTLCEFVQVRQTEADELFKLTNFQFERRELKSYEKRDENITELLSLKAKRKLWVTKKKWNWQMKSITRDHPDDAVRRLQLAQPQRLRLELNSQPNAFSLIQSTSGAVVKVASEVEMLGAKWSRVRNQPPMCNSKIETQNWIYMAFRIGEDARGRVENGKLGFGPNFLYFALFFLWFTGRPVTREAVGDKLSAKTQKQFLRNYFLNFSEERFAKSTFHYSFLRFSDCPVDLKTFESKANSFKFDVFFC